MFCPRCAADTVQLLRSCDNIINHSLCLGYGEWSGQEGIIILQNIHKNIFNRYCIIKSGLVCGNNKVRHPVLQSASSTTGEKLNVKIAEWWHSESRKGEAGWTGKNLAVLTFVFDGKRAVTHRRQANVFVFTVDWRRVNESVPLWAAAKIKTELLMISHEMLFPEVLCVNYLRTFYHLLLCSWQ